MSKLKIQTCGQGPQLVLLHGWAMHSGFWGSLLPALSKSFKVITVDLPGHGENVECLVEPELAAWVDAVAMAVDGPATWVGWSLGGVLALAVAKQYPDKIKQLILVASSPKFIQSEDWRPAMPTHAFESFASRIDASIPRFGLEYFLKLQVVGSEKFRESLQLMHTLFSAAPIPNYTALVQGLDLLEQVDAREMLSQVSQPIMLCLGEKDRLIPVSLGNAFLELQPAASLQVIPGAGHAPFLSQPEHFAGKIIEWVKFH